ncbi:uncharacterized protein B0P05DRAFT_522391 [Gilbertella persicaria]|uniref:uncharacterized protein n=1 Tax=Gilbertella persicaria TaxID=101096 RepID=UPI00221F07AE|nr:uncharacterized protein B0P05DRAFT_522391 [Gilbertella persicaria]KAI8097865.1 hypothetical protein B0P05DRAFT_522391 [Gilbertella persicaria]
MVLQYFMSVLLLALYGVEAKWMSEIPNAPERAYSKLFNIPTWITHIEDYDDDAFNATTIFSVVTVAVSTLYTLYHIIYVFLPKQPANQKTIGPFNTLIMLYLIATFVATFTFALMNAGRIWASFGVYHNLFEIALMSHIFLRQKSLLERKFVFICFIYLLITMFIVIIVPWPLDALFFKFQGLATDFALAIDLGRLYYHNKSNYKQASVGTLVTDDDEQDHNRKMKQVMMAPPHLNIKVLYIAATLHAVGNALVTFSNHFYLWVIFQFIYAIAFPMYAYYCVAEPNASRVSWYKVDYAKEVLVLVTGATLAGLCIAVGVYNAGIPSH